MAAKSLVALPCIAGNNRINGSCSDFKKKGFISQVVVVEISRRMELIGRIYARKPFFSESKRKVL
jgi:hypothetical protein